MSTIEKAAARLVKKKANAKPATEQRQDIDSPMMPAPVVVEKAEATNRVETTNKVDPTNAVSDGAHQENRSAETRDTQPVQLRADGQLAGASRDDTSVSRPAPDSGDTTSHSHDGYITSCELDFEWLKENGFLVPGHGNEKQSQEFRRIKRQLLVNIRTRTDLEKPPNLIFITSALPDEGKTFVSMNLALSLAHELDKEVLLIDADAAKGDLSKWMDIHGEPGLVDQLVEGNGYGESAIIETNVDRLSVMSCGKRRDNLDELYASKLMETLLDGLAKRLPNRIVVVDGPPLLATTEAAVLSSIMGQSVLVVAANATPVSAAEHAASMLQHSQLVSALLNKTDQLADVASYGYGYGYGQDAETEAASRK